MEPWPAPGKEGSCHPEPLAVTLSEAKGLQFRSGANKSRFFASLRMTDFRESEVEKR